ncbi:DegV family protein [Rossellomorea marisflavi]|uniref:DegV family protein n=1 Tax=Rossellomorea TaxID=2837508 RepID=UPI00064EF7D8|nr:DegV family protein [Rossellomorea marisflavi]KML01531.1 DegV domain-containing protein [Rossellomorea marisflavi]KML33988.1 DegV domain-containing protein [Rossellomorea marisflavi]MCM2604923.1 DegV family protein [Rossellomorea marisflavi]TYO72842.1 DegV family protein [Rossellomorea marisflavi]USK90521.1 DegV family protein [Rossellomorea marisflavi]
MEKIKIVTDSTADLSEDMIGDLDIHVVPLSIFIEGETYLDRVDLSPEMFLEKMKASDELPKSSQPSAGVFAELYDELGKDGSKVISIHMTGGMSGTVRSAESAAEITETDVTVVDSRFISRGLGFQVIEAARLAKEGKGVEDILEAITEIREKTQLYVVVDTLENLVKGGRIGKGKAMIGSLLNIKPIASLAGGEYTPVAKVRSHTQVVKFLVQQFMEDVKGKTIKGVGLCHADGLALAQNLKSKIAEKTGYDQFDIGVTTPIISTHTGIGAIGFTYYTD